VKTVQERTIDAGLAAAALETVDFEIESTAHAFRTLVDGLYTDKVSAVIREISTNAYDAQVEAGNGDLPFEVHLPTPLEPHFSVRDFGTSMTHAKVMEHYTKFFRSDRGETNDAVGQYGLGSKSPYAISDSFVVTAYLDGEARVYVASLNELGKPIFSHVSTLPSDEPNGLLVSVTPSEADYGKFLPSARNIYRFFPVSPTSNVDLDLPQAIAEGEGWALYSAPNSDKILVRQGTVAYPSGVSSPLNYGYELVVDVPIGTVSVTPSREALQRDETTVAALHSVIDPVLEDFRQNLVDQILEAPTYFEATRRYNRLGGFLYNGLARIRYGDPEAGPVITGNLTTRVEGTFTGTKRNSVLSDNVLVTITPGQQSTVANYVVDRTGAQLVRRVLRLSAYGKDRKVRVIKDPTPAQIKALYRAHRGYVTFTDITALPDVKINRAPRATRPKGMPVGVYTPGYASLLPMAADPEPGKYIAVPIERAVFRGSIIDNPFPNYGVGDLNDVFTTLSKHFDKPVVILSKAAVKRLKPTSRDGLQAHLDRYIAKVLPKYLASRRFRTIEDASLYGTEVLKELIGESRPAGVSVPRAIINRPVFQDALSAQADAVQAEIDDLTERFPLVFSRYDTVAVIEYINLLKEESK
jgi:hypothetical protein